MLELQTNSEQIVVFELRRNQFCVYFVTWGRLMVDFKKWHGCTPLFLSDYSENSIRGLLMMIDPSLCNCSADVVNWWIPHQYFYVPQHCVHFYTKGIDNQPLIFINSGWTGKLWGLTVKQEENKTGESFNFWITRENWFARKKSFMFIHDKKEKINLYSFKHAVWQDCWHGSRRSIRWALSSSGCLIGSRGDVL